MKDAELIQAYEKVLAERTGSLIAIPESLLPQPREKMRTLLIKRIKSSKPDDWVEMRRLKAFYTRLAHFVSDQEAETVFNVESSLRVSPVGFSDPSAFFSSDQSQVFAKHPFGLVGDILKKVENQQKDDHEAISAGATQWGDRWKKGVAAASAGVVLVCLAAISGYISGGMRLKSVSLGDSQVRQYMGMTEGRISSLDWTSLEQRLLDDAYEFAEGDFSEDPMKSFWIRHSEDKTYMKLETDAGDEEINADPLAAVNKMRLVSFSEAVLSLRPSESEIVGQTEAPLGKMVGRVSVRQIEQEMFRVVLSAIWISPSGQKLQRDFIAEGKKREMDRAFNSLALETFAAEFAQSAQEQSWVDLSIKEVVKEPKVFYDRFAAYVQKLFAQTSDIAEHLIEEYPRARGEYENKISAIPKMTGA